MSALNDPSLPLLVGESNPYGADPHFALYPFPESASGGRLAAILGMDAEQYLRPFDRVNLCTQNLRHWRQGSREWDAAAARRRAERLPHEARVLLGAKVARAHGLTYAPFASGWKHAEECAAYRSHAARSGGQAPRCIGDLSNVRPSCFRYLVLPHPSGRCRAWNDPRSAERARQSARAFLGPLAAPATLSPGAAKR